MSRFDYVKYDKFCATEHAKFKHEFEQLAERLDRYILPGRTKRTVMAKLEEAFMWVGKGFGELQKSRDTNAPDENLSIKDVIAQAKQIQDEWFAKTEFFAKFPKTDRSAK